MLSDTGRRERLREIDRVIKAGPYEDSWASLCRYEVPRWYRDAKFGIFIHWGVYSVPAFGNEWYPRNMYIKDSPEYAHHLAVYGAHKDFGYKDFVPLFRAERFDPAAWAASSGRRADMVPVAEHHDGFQMYRTGSASGTLWTGARCGTCWATCAPSGTGAGGGLSSHRIEHWFFMGHGGYFDSDVRSRLSRGLRGPPRKRSPRPPQQPPQPGVHGRWLLLLQLVDAYRPGSSTSTGGSSMSGPALPAQVRRLLLQQGGPVGRGRGDQLQA